MTDVKTTPTDTPAKETKPAAAKAEAAAVKASASKAKSKTPSKPREVSKPAQTEKTSTRKTTAAKKPAAKKSAPRKAAPKKPAVSAKPSVETKSAAATQTAAKPKVEMTMNQTIETMTSASNEAIKEGFEKTLSAVNDASSFHKETIDAIIESATVAGKGVETVNANAVSYAKTAMEEGVAVAKAVSSAKSVQEIFEIQSDYAKSTMDTYLSELNKTSELMSDMVKNTFKPLNDRVSAAVELAQSQR